MDLFKPDHLLISRAISTLEKTIIESGIAEIRLSSDMAELEVAAEEANKHPVASEMFERAFFTLPPNQLLWIGLYDEKNKCVCTCACKYEDIGTWSLQHHMNEYIERTWPGVGDPGTFCKIKKGSGTYASSVNGKTVYVGYGHVEPEWREKNLLGLSQRLLLLSAFYQWEPRILYGFMRPSMISKGYHLNWGYSLSCPKAFIWENPPEAPDMRDLCFVAVGTEGIRLLASDPLMVGTNRRLESMKK
ncbi:hypothetical protein [Roseibium sp.]|uniref:hypothetical protein n=1 Tax=Roseibium sp. TaxID=1936156 RepID=UPI003B52A2D7